MLERTKIGKQVRYAISDPSAFELCARVGGEMRRELQQLEALLGERDQVRAWAREPTLSR